MIRSVIYPHKQNTQYENEIYIDAEDFVLKCLEVMIQHKKYKLLVSADDAKCIGEVHLGDLIIFLTQDLDKVDTFVHKLNFTVESVVLSLMNQQNRT